MVVLTFNNSSLDTWSYSNSDKFSFFFVSSQTKPQVSVYIIEVQMKSLVSVFLVTQLLAVIVGGQSTLSVSNEVS